MICDRKIAGGVEGKVYNVEMVALTKRQGAEVEVLRFSLGVTASGASTSRVQFRRSCVETKCRGGCCIFGYI